MTSPHPRLARAVRAFLGLALVAHFVVKSGTGAYARTRGGGLASFSEDAADHDRMTVIGRITR